MDNGKGAAASARRVIILCFFLTGFSGIVYEIVWVRQFTLVFGNTVYAVGAVLAAFMAGLGMGGRFFGARIDRSGHPILYYAVLELLVGGYALLMPWIVRFIELSGPGMLSALGDSRGALFAAKFALSFVALFLPTFFMGASLPLLTRWFVRRRAAFGNIVSSLYGLNTLGAVLGVFAATFIMLPYAGVTKTTIMAFAINAGAGLLAALQYLKLKAVAEDADAEPSEPPEQPLAPVSGRSAALAVALLSGFMSMVFEVAWTRTLALLIGSSIYSFSLVLLTFLLGIAIGGFICARYYRTRRGSFAALAACQFGAVVTAAVALPLLPLITQYVVAIIPKIATQPALVFASNFAVCVVMLLAPTIFLGVSFPMAAELFADRAERSAGAVGRVYLYNTIGAIAGSILAGFVLIPALGVKTTLIIGMALGLAGGAVALAFAGGIPLLHKLVDVAAVAVIAGLVAVSPFWRPELMSGGPFVYAGYISRVAGGAGVLKTMKDLSGDILYYRDGAVATVSVHRKDGNTFLKVNGKTDASTRSDMYTQVLSAYIPMLMKPDAEDALIIGIGSGTTAGRALEFPLKTLNIVEIEKGVVEGSKFFEAVNNRYWEDKRARIILEDARNYLLLDGNKYDVIISEPSNPWMAGVAGLYTTEAFTMMRDHLKPGGIHCQWFQKYQLSEFDLGIAMTTFAEVFPHMTVFRGAGGDLLIIGSNDKIKTDFRDFQRRIDANPRVKEGLRALGIRDALSLLVSSYVADKNYLRAAFAHVNLRQTDDTPYLEYFAPLDIFVIPHDFLGNRYWEIFDEIPRVFNATAADFTRDTRLSLADQFNDRIPNPAMAAEILKRLVDENPRDAEALRKLAAIREAAGRQIAMERLYLQILEVDPRDYKTASKLALLYMKQGLPYEARAVIRRLAELSPGDAGPAILFADVLMMENKWSEAYTAYESAARLVKPDEKPLLAQCRFRMSEAAAKMKNRELEIENLKLSVEAAPNNYNALVRLAEIYLDRGDVARARYYTSAASKLNSNNAYFKHLLFRLRGAKE